MTEHINVSLKSKKLYSDVIKTNNVVVNDKLFIGFDKNDTNTLKTLSSDNNNNLIIKKDSLFKNNVKIENNLYIGNKINNVHHNANLNVQGDTILSGPVNIGFKNDIPSSSSALNINGNNEIYGDNIVYGSNFIKNNLFVYNKTTFNDDVYLSNTLSLDDEKINNMIINNDTLTSADYKILLNNILNNLTNLEIKNNSSLKFISKNTSLCSSVLSVSKNFIISNNKYTSFLLVYAIYSKNKIITCKPIIDTFILLNEKEQIVKINDNINVNTSSELTSMIKKSNTETSDTDIDFFLNN